MFRSPVPGVHTDGISRRAVLEAKRLVARLLLIEEIHQLVGCRNEACLVVLLGDEQQTVYIRVLGSSNGGGIGV